MPHLYLSHWDSKDVYVPSEHVEDLKPYHVDCVRALYEAYSRKFKGKLISYPDGINVAVVLRAFLAATLEEFKSPVLVLCASETTALSWHFELSKLASAAVSNFECGLTNIVDNKPSIMIGTVEKLKNLQDYAEQEWAVVVAESIEAVVNKLAFKRIGNVQFKVALTKTDFMYSEDLKVFWHVLNWCNPQLFGKLAEFAEAHKQHRDNLRDPYGEVWYRIEWDLPDNYLTETEAEYREYKKLVREWADVNDINVGSSTIASSRRSIKRKLEERNS